MRRFYRHLAKAGIPLCRLTQIAPVLYEREILLRQWIVEWTGVKPTAAENRRWISLAVHAMAVVLYVDRGAAHPRTPTGRP